MAPKDLLVHLEKGDRTMYHLTHKDRHDTELINAMLGAIQAGDLVTATRYLAGQQTQMSNQMNQYQIVQNPVLYSTNSGLQGGNVTW
jgi:hypothetical protein